MSTNSELIYFDHAASSFPKPPSVHEAMSWFGREVGANSGRSAHRLSLVASEMLFETRQIVARKFGINNPMRVAFTSGATHALNLAIQGMVKKYDRVVTSAIEHNASMRVLTALGESHAINVVIGPTDAQTKFDLELWERLLSAVPSVCVVNHASNVVGTVAPIAAIGKMCRDRGIVFIVDVAQSAGVIDIDMVRDSIDILAFAGHKSLLGPMGTGGLVIREDFDHRLLKPLIYGGTGSRSHQTLQPEFMPDCFESGTLNLPGIYGLYEGIKYLDEFERKQSVHSHKKTLVKRFVSGAEGRIESFKSYVSWEQIETGTVAFNIGEIDPATLAGQLDERFGIMCRAGLHCAPLVHQTIGTFPVGALRFSFGIFNTLAEVDAAVDALVTIGLELGGI